jgi:hypothetical protein
MTFADKSATWTSAGALALAALFLALGIVLFWRWRRAAAHEIVAVQESTARTERLVGEIRAALGDAQEEGRRIALLGGLGATLDLDAALRRALEAVSALTGADAAMIVLRREGEPITAAFGLSEEESTRQLIGLPSDGGRARAVRIGYLYSAEAWRFRFWARARTGSARSPSSGGASSERSPTPSSSSSRSSHGSSGRRSRTRGSSQKPAGLRTQTT